MIFGFGKNNADDYDEDDELELEQISFQGAVNGVAIDFENNEKLARVGLERTKRLYSEVMAVEAQLLRLESKGDKAIAQVMIDGVPKTLNRMTANEAMAIVQMSKLLAGLDVKERKKPQHGGIKAEYDDHKYNYEVKTEIASDGKERLIVRIHDGKNPKESLDDLNYGENIKPKIRELADQKGLILATGPALSGVSTLGFALLRGIDAYIYAMFSLVDPLHRDLKGVARFDVNEEESLDEALARLKRVEGDMAFIDPLTKKEDAKAALTHAADITVISEIQGIDAATALVNLCKMTGDPKLVAENTRAVFSQKLIRQLCQKCRQPYRPNPKVLKQMGLDPEEVRTLFRATKPDHEDPDYRPCRVCNAKGYMGQIPMVEYIEMTPEMKELVATGPDASEIKQLARKQKMQTLRSDGLRMISEGLTSVEELQRVFTKGK